MRRRRGDRPIWRSISSRAIWRGCRRGDRSPSNGKGGLMTNALRGSCLCGEIRFEIDGKIGAAGQCHCSKCRKVSGTDGNAVFYASTAGFRRSEEHTSELQSLMRISYAVFCLKKKTTTRSQIKTSKTPRTHTKYD